jgi:hypothetical protein
LNVPVLGIRILFLTVLLAVTAKAQGTIYLWSWHATGVYQPFRASFEVTEGEMQSWAQFNSSLFYNSIYFTNVYSGYEFRYDAPWSSVQVSYEPFFLSMVHHDASHSASLSTGAMLPGPQYAGFIEETDPNGQQWIQHGYWAIEQIPEPSVVALALLGAILLLWNGRKCSQYGSCRWLSCLLPQPGVKAAFTSGHGTRLE